MPLKKILCFLLPLFILYLRAPAQTDSIQQRIFLIGDAGALYNGRNSVIDWLKEHVNWNDTGNTAIFLGDNIYQMGLPLPGAPGYQEAKAIIDYQIGLVKGKRARAFFVPGNHDWMNGAPGGEQQVVNQTNYINGLGESNIRAYPLNACPGPVLHELDNKVVLVFGDSQWFLHLHDKPGPGSSCAAKTIEEFVTELNEILVSHQNQLLIFAVHHPFYTYGSHGGDYTWKDHIFPFTALSKNLYIPLPVIGSAYPIARGIFGNVQDIYHPLYRNFINEVENTLKKHPNPIHVSGHEHGLQLNVKDSIPYIVSGSGAKISRLKTGKYSVFSHLNYGFAMVEVRSSGAVSVQYYDINSSDLKDPVYTRQLKTIVPVIPESSLDTQSYSIPDYVTVAPDQRLKATGLKQFLVGRNYRSDWITPIRVPVLDIGKEAGGLTPVRQSGGGQLRMLSFRDKKGQPWILRSVERFPQQVIPSDLRTPIDPELHEDANSAAYPFASLIVADLSRSAGIPTSRLKLVYVPDDPRFTRFRNDFSNRIGILEEVQPPGVRNTISTNQLMVNLRNEPYNDVDQKRVLQARLMDNFVLNFNRNENAWTWATRDTGRRKLYYPVPSHSSHAFFVSQGVIPKLAHRILAIPEIQGFDEKADNIVSFNRSAYNFDNRFLNGLTPQDWEAGIDTFLARISDSAITAAFRSGTYATKSANGAAISAELKERRQVFKEEMMDYYRFLSRYVTVTGSAHTDRYEFTGEADGSVLVRGFTRERSGRGYIKKYERSFSAQETKELRVYGMEGNDSFLISGYRSPIKVILVGGPGDDYFSNSSSSRDITIYDASFEQNVVHPGVGLISKFSPDPAVNRFDRNQLRYDYISPGLSIAYNIDDGALPGAEIEVFRNRFRKQPYSSRHLLQVQYATNTRSAFFHYESDFTDVYNKLDVIIRANLRGPEHITNFFGLGNETRYELSKVRDIGYYRVNYDYADLSVMMRRNLQSWMNADLGPSFRYFKVEASGSGQHLSETMKVKDNLLQPRYFAGAEGRLAINSRNNEVLPTRGALLRMYARPLFGLNAVSDHVLQMGFDLSIFMSINPNTRTVLGTRFGIGHNIGHFDFPMAQYLSGPENLRGYRKDRFAGRTMVFNNTELRFRLKQFKTYLFPGSFGMLLFHDIGRVWMDGERSTVWHNGYGGGLWLSPVQRFVLTATLAHSADHEVLPAIGFGFQF